MPEIQINGYVTYYEGDDFTAPWAARQTILIQHGFGRNSQFWRHWVPMLAGDYRVIRRDLRGHGGSGDPGNAYPWSFDELVKDLAAFCDALDLRDVHLLGESTGGMLAVGYVATHPSRVRSLTLCGTPTTIGPAEQKFLALGHDTWQGALTEMGSEGWARTLLSQPGTAPRGDEARTQWSIQQFARAKTESLVGYSRVVSTTDVTPLLAEVRVPALVLAPTRSAATPMAEQERIAAAMAQGEIVRIAGEGHEIYIDRPEECVSALRSFLAAFR
ncbi:MAG TPA: alpha/beta hydrolase [Candidatus Acidoferrum sp.]|jgi:pimeloyl-ACP methyl ester carboxylesterase|nr:alpha/beta hydrolase [Candidatus Acidoferrum sp.]